MLHHITEKEHSMKRGHITGHKTERTGKGWWYQTPEAEAIIRRLEQEEATRQAKQARQ